VAYGVASSLLAFALWFFLTYRVGVVPSDSMAPTLKPGDRYLINIRAYRARPPEHGDVIVFRQNDGEYLVKRVIGVGGDWVTIAWGRVYLNGHLLSEPYAVGGEADSGPPQTVYVKPGEVFVLGDNRDWSEDSRDFGPVALHTILGRAERIISPKQRRGPISTQRKEGGERR
jgi:signal peptidase I